MQAGDLIDERYHLLSRRQTAWLAADRLSGRQCLIKPKASFTDPRVAAWLGQVWHSGLPRLLGELDGSGHEPCFIFEYLAGRTLDELASENQGRITLKRLMPLLVQAARILAFMHQQNEVCILHLDIKPENLLLNEQDQISLIDFGAARLMTSGPSDTTEGQAQNPVDRLALTPDYAAPELLAGYPGPGCDLYALGLTALHLLTGLPPSACRSRPLPELVKDLPGGLQRLIGSLLHTDAAIRSCHASELAAGLSAELKAELDLADHEDRREKSTAASVAEQTAALKQPAAVHDSPADLPSECPTDNQPSIDNQPDSETGRQYGPAADLAKAPVLCVWDGAELGCELAAVVAADYHSQILVIDTDLLNPQADFLLGQDKARQPVIKNNGLSGLDLVLSEDQSGHLDISALNHLAVSTQVQGVKLFATHCSLDLYEYFQLDSLNQMLSLARLICDLVIILCSRFVFDAFTCLSLQTADLVLVSLSGNSGSFRTCNRAVEFLHSRQQLDVGKIRYAVFSYDPRTDLSWGTMDELCCGRLAGCISEQPRRRKQKSGATPYAASLDRNNRREYLDMIRRVNLAAYIGKGEKRCL